MVLFDSHEWLFLLIDSVAKPLLKLTFAIAFSNIVVAGAVVVIVDGDDDDDDGDDGDNDSVWPCCFVEWFVREHGVVGDLLSFPAVPVIACELFVVLRQSVPQPALVCKFDVNDKKINK